VTSLPRLGAETRTELFPAIGDLTYLNTAASGIPPQASVATLTEEAAKWAASGADNAGWDARIETARELAAGLLKVSPTSVAHVSSHALAASMIARQLPDANVVIPAGEFRSNLLPWVTTRSAERVRLVPDPATTDRVCAAIDAGTDVVALASVQSADGLRVDLRQVVARAREVGALVYVDASQSFGVDTTLSEIGADFVGAVGYKWILGARGASYLMVAPEHHERFAPWVASPEVAVDYPAGAYYGADFEAWTDARRFDQPPAWLCWTVAAPSLRLVTEYGVAALEAHGVALATRFRESIEALGLRTGALDVPSTFVTVPHPDASRIARELLVDRIKIAARGGGMRFSFHLYNDESDVDRAVAAVAAAVR
jgi:selenocysteine lyase/cysteine desulfurase